MPAASLQRPGEQITGFKVILLLLSLFVLTALLVDTLFDLPVEVSKCLQAFDTFICAVFLFDFILNFKRAANKSEFMKWGWIDLIASIPSIDLFRWGRLVRILKIIRVLRGIRSLKKLLEILFNFRTTNAFVSVVFVSFLLVAFASMSILVCENSPNSNISTAGDAIWWAVSTITTVGYGDRFPVTVEGRMIAMALMISGVGLFGTLSAFLGAYFLGKADDDSEEIKEMRKEIAVLGQKMDSMVVHRQVEPSVKIETDRQKAGRLD